MTQREILGVSVYLMLLVAGCGRESRTSSPASSGPASDANAAAASSSSTATGTGTGSSSKTSAADPAPPAPALVSITPSSSPVHGVPSTVFATFSAPIQTPPATLFLVGGSCGSKPTVSASIAMSADKTAASATLTGGGCANGETLTVSIDPTAVTSLAGAAGTGQVVKTVYTVSTEGPSANLGSPSSTLLNSTGSSTLVLTFTPSAAEGSALTGVLAANGSGVTVTAVTGNPACAVDVSSITTSGAVIGLSSCSGDGTLTVHVDAGALQDGLGAASTSSPESAVITVANTGPTVTLGPVQFGAIASSPWTASIPVTFTASAEGETTLTGALTANGGGVALALTGNLACTVGVSAITTSGASIDLSCSGDNGTGTVTVDAGVLADALGNLSAVGTGIGFGLASASSPPSPSPSPTPTPTPTPMPAPWTSLIKACIILAGMDASDLSQYVATFEQHNPTRTQSAPGIFCSYNNGACPQISGLTMLKAASPAGACFAY